ncbi:MAG: CoA pyrophosphatase [Pseudomonadota bacterium]
MFTIDHIAAELHRQPVESNPFVAEPSHAAVAMIIRDGVNELDVCFIRRAEKQGDPWSGQVAFPGGRAESVDEDAPAVAERETHEEIGLVLSREQMIGALPESVINRSHQPRPLTLSPFVYYVPTLEADLRGNEEVAAIFWVPMSHLFDTGNITELEWGGSDSLFPGIQFDEHVIWGLTLRVLGTFAERMNHTLPALRS